MEEKPKVSIGICAHNEEETIGKLLEQVADEQIPVKEVIVVVAGDDKTAEIASGKENLFNSLKIIEEEERRGQIVAQNKIMDEADAEAVLTLDGDGLIKDGSLEILYSEFDTENVVSGREVPITENSITGEIIDTYGRIHSKLCERTPRFATHLGIFPQDLIQSFPEIILDDVYIEHKAIKNKMDIVYKEEAVKYHNMPENLHFFFNQQRKNWTGRFEAGKKGYKHTKPAGLLLKVFISYTVSSSPREITKLVALSGIEFSAYSFAAINSLLQRFNVKWRRP